MRFFNFFFNQMTQKYQNEKSPILNGQKKSKTSEKVQKMRDLEGPTSFRPFENTRYMEKSYSIISFFVNYGVELLHNQQAPAHMWYKLLHAQI